MRMIAFLRAVMPTGKNRIPKMSYLAEIVSNAGYKNKRLNNNFLEKSWRSPLPCAI